MKKKGHAYIITKTATVTYKNNKEVFLIRFDNYIIKKTILINFDNFNII
jgi:hypothetical protein